MTKILETTAGRSLQEAGHDRDRDSYTENQKLGTARLVQSTRVGRTYEASSFNVSNNTTDYDVDVQGKAFQNRTWANYVKIWTDQTITVKLNSTGNDAITVTTTDSPFVVDWLEVNAIYITNASGSTAAIKLLVV